MPLVPHALGRDPIVPTDSVRCLDDHAYPLCRNLIAVYGIAMRSYACAR